jgi:hypothetical protein
LKRILTVLSAAALTFTLAPQAQAALPSGSPVAHVIDVVYMSKDGTFELSDAEINELVGAVSDFWVRESRGEISSITVRRTMKIQTEEHCATSYSNGSYKLVGHTAWTAAAEAYGSSYIMYQVTKGAHILGISPRSDHGTAGTANCPASYTGYATSAGGWSWGGAIHLIYSDVEFNKQSLAHEFGHNLQLNHAGSLICPQGMVEGPYNGTATASYSGCGVEEYGNMNNPMGNTHALSRQTINGAQKQHLGIIQEGAGYLDIDAATAPDGATYTLTDATTTDLEALQALHITDDTGNTHHEYWVEYSTAEKEDGNVPGVFVTREINDQDTELKSLRQYHESVVLRFNGKQYMTQGTTFNAISGQLGVEFVSQGNGVAVIKLHTPNTFTGPLCTGTLKITGVPNVGRELAATGLTCQDGVSVQYTWSSRTSGASYTPTASVLGSKLTVTATATYGNLQEVYTAETARQIRYFTDVPSNQRFYQAINQMVQRGVVSTSGEYFWPDRELTRGELAAYLYRLAGRPAFTRPATATFTDVPRSHMFSVEVEWAAANAITLGKGNNTFKPDDSVTRGEVAAFLHRVDTYLYGVSTFSTSVQHFKDVPKTHTFYWDVEWALSMAIATGNPEYFPARPCLRDEFSALASRWLQSRAPQVNAYGP